MIAANKRLVVLERVARSSNCGASVRSIMAWTVITGSRSKTTRCSRDGSDLRITKTARVTVTLPELDARAASIAVSWAGTKSLLLLVVAAEAQLKNGGEEEEKGAEDGDGEAGRVELADGAERGGVGDLATLAVAAKTFFGVGGSVAEGSGDVSGAALGAVTSEDCDGHHGAAAGEVEKDGEERKDGLSTKAECQQNSEDGV